MTDANHHQIYTTTATPFSKPSFPGSNPRPTFKNPKTFDTKFAELSREAGGAYWAETFLLISEEDRTFKYPTEPEEMSTSKSSKKPSHQFDIEDVDQIVLSSSKKSKRDSAAPSGRTMPTRSKSAAKKKRSSGNNDPLSEAFTSIREYLEEKVQEVESSLNEVISSKDKQIQELKKQAKETTARLTSDHEKQFAHLKADATKTILTARIRFVEEANDPGFDRSKWNVDGWKAALADLNGGDAEEQDEVLVLGTADAGEAEGVEGLLEMAGEE